MNDRATHLRRERQETFERLVNLSGDFDQMVAASRESNADDEHDPEGSTIAFERASPGAPRDPHLYHLHIGPVGVIVEYFT